MVSEFEIKLLSYFFEVGIDRLRISGKTKVPKRFLRPSKERQAPELGFVSSCAWLNILER